MGYENDWGARSLPLSLRRFPGCDAMLTGRTQRGTIGTDRIRDWTRSLSITISVHDDRWPEDRMIEVVDAFGDATHIVVWLAEVVLNADFRGRKNNQPFYDCQG